MAMSLTSTYQFEPGQSKSYLSARQLTVLPEYCNHLSYSPHVIAKFVIDCSTETMPLELSVSNVKLCWSDRRL